LTEKRRYYEERTHFLRTIVEDPDTGRSWVWTAWLKAKIRRARGDCHACIREAFAAATVRSDNLQFASVALH
jgi:hypothetical protein